MQSCNCFCRFCTGKFTKPCNLYPKPHSGFVLSLRNLRPDRGNLSICPFSFLHPKTVRLRAMKGFGLYVSFAGFGMVSPIRQCPKSGMKCDHPSLVPLARFVFLWRFTVQGSRDNTFRRSTADSLRIYVMEVENMDMQAAWLQSPELRNTMP